MSLETSILIESEDSAHSLAIVHSKILVPFSRFVTVVFGLKGSANIPFPVKTVQLPISLFKGVFPFNDILSSHVNWSSPAYAVVTKERSASEVISNI